jgi:AcrR family transcriptional regulator
MQDIADELSIAKGTIYEYFPNKEDLFLAVYDIWMDEYEQSMNKAVEEHFDPVSKADALIDTTVEFYEKHAKYAPLLLEFWAHALRSSSDVFLIRIRKMKKRLTELGVEVTIQMQKLHLFKKVDASSFAVLELGISDGIFLQWVLDGQQYSLREAYKFRQSVIGSGLMTDTLRTMVASKVEKKLKQGFINQSTKRS